MPGAGCRVPVVIHNRQEWRIEYRLTGLPGGGKVTGVRPDRAEHHEKSGDAMKTLGTTNSGTEVQRATEMTDSQLEAAFLEAMDGAEKAAGVVIDKMHTAALRIVDLHRREAWCRITDSEGKQVWSSPVAYYSHLASAEKFPKVHKTLRDGLMTALFAITADESGEVGMPIGYNELAALINTDKSQVSISAKEIKAKIAAEQAERDAEAEAEAKAEALAEVKAEAHAEAMAEAEEKGLTTEQAEAEAQSRVAMVQRMHDAEAAKAAKAAEAKAEAAKAAADRKVTAQKVKRAKGALEQALKGISGLQAEMSEADQVWCLTLVKRAVIEWTPEAEDEDGEIDLDKAEDKAEAEAEATEVEITVPHNSPVDPTGISGPKPSAPARGRGRKAASA